MPSVLRPGGPTWLTLVPARTLPYRRLRLHGGALVVWPGLLLGTAAGNSLFAGSSLFPNSCG